MNEDTRKELDKLLLALSSESLDDAGRDELEQLLKDDPEAMEHYLDYVDVECLLTKRFAKEAALPAELQNLSPGKKPRVKMFYRFAAAAAACFVLGVVVWMIGWSERPINDDKGGKVPTNVHGVVMLAPGWQGEARGADYAITSPGTVTLVRGELYIKSVPMKNANTTRGPLEIQTPNATATATGTEFYVGIHGESNEQDKKMNKLTRVLVLSGVVTLANSLGTVSGEARDLLIADGKKAPVKHVVKANADFAVDLYKQLAKEQKGKNLFFSPYSISSALAMVAEGARGETAMEMGKVLCYPKATRRVGDKAQGIPWQTSLIHSGMADLNQVINDSSSAETLAARARLLTLEKEFEEKWEKVSQTRQKHGRDSAEFKAALKEYWPVKKELDKLKRQTPTHEVRVANAMWGDQSYPFDETYVKTLNKFYQTGGVRLADFGRHAGAARKTINDWVAEQTNNKINNLLPHSSVGKDTRLVITSALYFKARWETEFFTSKTETRDFTLGDGSTIKTAIMFAKRHDEVSYAAFNPNGSLFRTPARMIRGQARYPGAGGFAMIDLPYKGEDFAMLVIAPNDPKGLPALEKMLTGARLATWVSHLKKRDTHVYLPKFKLATDYMLGSAGTSGPLQRMGMVRAFRNPQRNGNGAQFQGMTSSKEPDDQLFIDQVLHKAVIDVDERGTEAAAATAAAANKSEDPRYFIPTFTADRPFIFAIRDTKNGNILFLGRVTNPLAGQETAKNDKPFPKAEEIAEVLKDTGAHINGGIDNRYRKDGILATDYFKTNKVSRESLEKIRAVGFKIPFKSGNPHVLPVHLKWIAMLPNLESLSLEACKLGYDKKTFTGDGLAVLADCPKLIELNLNDTYINTQDLAGVAKIKGLKRLYLNSTSIGDQGMKLLATMPALEFVRIPSWVTDKGIESLVSLKNLKGIHVWEPKGDFVRITRMIGRKKSMEILRLGGTDITDREMKLLGELTLKELDLSHSDKITDEGFKHIIVGNLRVLDLGGCDRIGDGTLKRLERVKNLETLYLTSCRGITDQGLAALGKVKTLRTVYFSDCKITDEGLKQLDGLKNLKAVMFRRCKQVTPEGIKRFRKIHPNCRIES